MYSINLVVYHFDRECSPRFGSRYVLERPAQNFVQDVCHQVQPCTSAQTNPTPGLTLSLALWGARGRQGQSRGFAACFGGGFPKKRRAAERHALTYKTRSLHKVSCRLLLHMCRVPRFGSCSEIMRQNEFDAKNGDKRKREPQ